MTITQSISPLPTVPDPNTPATFPSLAPPFTTAIAAMAVQLEAFRVQANALAAALNAISVGNAFAMAYTFSSTITVADPTAGFLRLNNATQASATALSLALLDSGGITQTSQIDTFGTGTSTVKGYVRLVKASDATKWINFELTAVASPAGYKSLTVQNGVASGANPFTNLDALVVVFTPKGDKGDTGATGGTGAAGAAGSASVVSVTNASGAATVDFTALDPLFDYRIRFDNVRSSVDGDYLMLRVSEDNTTWKAGATDYDWVNSGMSGATASAITTQATGTTFIKVAGNLVNDGALSNAAPFQTAGQLTIYKPGSANNKLVRGELTQSNGTRSLDLSFFGGSYKGTVNAVTGLRMLASTGTLTGTFILEKIARS